MKSDFGQNYRWVNETSKKGLPMEEGVKTLIRISFAALLISPGCMQAPLRPPLMFDKEDSFRSVHTIETRPGVRQSFYIVEPQAAEAKTLIIFPGGSGKGQVQTKGDRVFSKGSFVARTVDLWKRKYRVVVIDVPSDRPYQFGMSEEFRQGPRHLEDVTKVMDYLSVRGSTEFFLIGTSLGTISAAWIGSSGDPRIKGIILTATHVEKAKSPKFSEIRIPVLLVSHRDDACKFTQPADSRRLAENLSKVTSAQYIEISGGVSTGPACEAFSHHGFNGVEQETISQMDNWISQVGSKIDKR